MDSLSKLPNELLIMLPKYMDNIEDFMNASSSCRKLRAALTDTNPNTILRLAAASSRIFFRPDPFFLVMATAHEIGQWGLKSIENTEILRAAMRRGIDGLFELCVAKCGLTMDRIRYLHLARFNLINPVSDMIDKMAGKQWYSTPNFWGGGVSEPCTVACDPKRTLFQFIIYGELFGSTMKAYLQPSLLLPRYDLDARLDYIRYCVPDEVGYFGCPGLPWPQRDGPYSTRRHTEDGNALWHVTRCRRWKRAWSAVRKLCVPGLEDFDEPWRQALWTNSIQYHGLDGLEMLRPGGPEKWKASIEEIYSQVEQLDASQRPGSRFFGPRRNEAYECPSLIEEAYVCVAFRWQSSSVTIDPWLNQERVIEPTLEAIAAQQT